jgi:acyl dehydratase
MTHVDIATLSTATGREMAVSDWVDVTQALVGRFGDVIGDRQWIHVDADRAARESPWGTTVAHGFLTLSLLTLLARRAMVFDGVSTAINYGLNRVRFPAAVPVGSRVRGRFAVQASEPVAGGLQVTWAVTVEIDGAPKPGCVAEWIVRYLVT